jgi:hypothetical protein
MRKQASNLGNALVGRDDDRLSSGIYLRQSEFQSGSPERELSSRSARLRARAGNEREKANEQEAAHEGF